MIESLLSRLTGRNARPQSKAESKSRLAKLVARERSAVAEAAHEKLSRQATDPPPQEDVTPLYDISAYVSQTTYPDEKGSR